MADSRPTTAEHLDRTRKLAAWLEAAIPGDKGVTGSAAADLADLVYAAADVRALLGELVQCDLGTSAGRERAAQLAADIRVQLDGEVKHHVDSVLPFWDRLLARFDEV